MKRRKRNLKERPKGNNVFFQWIFKIGHHSKYNQLVSSHQQNRALCHLSNRHMLALCGAVQHKVSNQQMYLIQRMDHNWPGSHSLLLAIPISIHLRLFHK